MTRSWGTVAYLLSAALVAVVALLPFSSWVFRNHLDLLTGGWTVQGQWTNTWIFPSRVLDRFDATPKFEPSWAAEKRKPKLMDLANVRDEAQNADPPTLALLYKGTLQEQSVLRYAGQSKQTSAIEDNYRKQIEVAKRGTQIDSNNAFWWVMLASSYYISGELPSCYAALAQAARCSRYESYASAEERSRYAEFLARAGYRGERAREAIISSLGFPHLGALTFLGQAVRQANPTRESVQAQADLLKLAATIQRSSDMSIELMVARNIQRRILTPTNTAKRRDMVENNDLARWAPLFIEKEKKWRLGHIFDPRPSVAASDRLVKVFFDLSAADSLESFEAHGFLRTVGAPLVLLALILAVAITAVASKLDLGGRVGRRMAQFLLAATGFWLSGVHATREGLGSYTIDFILVLALVCLGLLQFHPKLARPAMIAGAVLCGAAAIAGYPVPVSYLPAICFFAVAALTKLRLKLPVLLVGLGLAGWCLTVSYFCVQIVLRGPQDVWLAAILAVLLATAFAFLAAGSPKVRQVAPAVVLMLAISYIVGVAYDLRMNEMLRASLDGWQTQADLLRAKADIAPSQRS